MQKGLFMEDNRIRFTSSPDEIPSDEANALRGNIQQVLLENIGLFVSIDFLIGAATLVTKQGVLYSVGVSFLVLYDPSQGTYMVCDLYAVKFVTFFNPEDATSARQ